jgi:RNA polymerase sigma-70 factor (ECF subfamily)
LDLDNLINSCVKQNRPAQEALYNLYSKTLFVLSLKYCSNEKEAEDNVHNAFIEIFTNIKKFDNKGSFEGWMKRITINKAIDSYKKSYKLEQLHDDYQDEVLVNDDDIKCSLDQLLKIIQELPNQYRLVFNLYELDDYSHRQIATMLSISESTSKSNLHRAKQILKGKLLSKVDVHKTSKNGK